jgi:hypothetical protein
VSAITGPCPRDYLKDRAGHGVGPIPGDVMAGAVDDDMASSRAATADPAHVIRLLRPCVLSLTAQPPQGSAIDE